MKCRLICGCCCPGQSGRFLPCATLRLCAQERSGPLTMPSRGCRQRQLKSEGLTVPPTPAARDPSITSLLSPFLQPFTI